MTNPGLKKPIRVRFAPSPTGKLHIGSVRSALFNWLFARHNAGKFFLRIEDTDKERSKKEYEDEIIEGLKWLGIEWDGEIYRQSERGKYYRKNLEKLLEEGRAYYCYCTKEELEAQKESMTAEGLPPKYSGHCRNLKKALIGREPEVIRFAVPEVEIEFKDLIRGTVKFDAGLLGDIVIAKDLDTPLYNFAVVVDDGMMEITHVIRGEDHISNTPKQILIQRALGFDVPIFAHVPLILAPDRSKLSKRRAEASFLDYRDRGYLPEAMVNFLALLGWHSEGNEEIFSRQDLIKLFDISRVQKSGAVFNEDKLAWLNSQHIRRLSQGEIFERLQPWLENWKIKASRDFIQKVISVVKDRMRTLGEFFELAGFFFGVSEYDRALLKWKGQALPDVRINLQKILEAFQGLSVGDFTAARITVILDGLVDGAKRGEVFWPFRVALSGKLVSPDPAEIAEILGKEEVLRRVKVALDKLERE